MTAPWLATRILVIAGVVLVGPCQLDAQDLQQPVVVTTGEGIIRAVPDRAYVTITAESRGRNPRDTERQNAEAMTAVQGRLKEARIPAEAIRTVAYDLQPEFDYVDGRQSLRGYLARNSIEVRVDEIERTGEIVDLAVGSGATSVSGIRFDLKDRVRIEREALKEAVADARARADAAAAGAGRAIDRVLRIEEQRAAARPRPPMMVMARAAEAESVPETPISPGQIEVRAQVTLTAALKN